MPRPQFSLKWLLGVIAAVASWLALVRDESIFSYGVLLAVTFAAVLFATYRAVRAIPTFRPFSSLFALVGWIGLAKTLAARLPYPDISLLQSMAWSLERADSSWFDSHGAAHFGLIYLSATLGWALFFGMVAAGIYSAGKMIGNFRGQRR